MEASNTLLFDAILLILPTVLGGRASAVLHNGGAYRPHAIVATDPSITTLGIAITGGPEQLQKDVQFTVVEGRRLVGIGRITRRWATSLQPSS